MKKMLVIIFLIVFSSVFFASEYEALLSEFVQIRAMEDTEMMAEFIENLSLRTWKI